MSDIGCIGCADEDCLPCIREARDKLESIANELRRRLNRVIGENLALEHRIAAVEAAGRELSMAVEGDPQWDHLTSLTQDAVLKFDTLLLAEADAGKPSTEPECPTCGEELGNAEIIAGVCELCGDVGKPSDYWSKIDEAVKPSTAECPRCGLELTKVFKPGTVIGEIPKYERPFPTICFDDDEDTPSTDAAGRAEETQSEGLGLDLNLGEDLSSPKDSEPRSACEPEKSQHISSCCNAPTEGVGLSAPGGLIWTCSQCKGACSASYKYPRSACCNASVKYDAFMLYWRCEKCGSSCALATPEPGEDR